MNNKKTHNEAVAEMYLKMMYGNEYDAIVEMHYGKRNRLLEAGKKIDDEEKSRLKDATVKKVAASAAWENYLDLLGGSP